MVSIDYKDDFPVHLINQGEAVFIVDFGPEPEIMRQIIDKIGITSSEAPLLLTWIDHHKTTLEKYKDFKFYPNGRVPDGIRRVGDSGCFLTWEHFKPKDAMPLIVRLIDDWDTWKHKMDPTTNYLQAGLTTINADPNNQEFWANHLRNPILPIEVIVDFQLDLLKPILEKGCIITEQRENSNRGLVAEWAFPVDWEGLHFCALNFGKGSSKIFDSVKDKYDAFITFIYDGRKYTVSLYTDRPDLDVSKIALKYGGGGHRGACGFTCRELPFRRKDE
jgi:oligoribonuclease NrnB/cAMP/cGMP phosphodiesterase (DHH superfamily)